MSSETIIGHKSSELIEIKRTLACNEYIELMEDNLKFKLRWVGLTGNQSYSSILTQSCVYMQSFSKVE